jgi:hypothetical protein
VRLKPLIHLSCILRSLVFGEAADYSKNWGLSAIPDELGQENIMRDVELTQFVGN